MSASNRQDKQRDYLSSKWKKNDFDKSVIKYMHEMSMPVCTKQSSDTKLVLIPLH